MSDSDGNALGNGGARGLASGALTGLPRRQKNRLRGIIKKVKARWIEEFRSFEKDDLVTCLLELGIEKGDTVMLHSAFEASGVF